MESARPPSWSAFDNSRAGAFGYLMGRPLGKVRDILEGAGYQVRIVRKDGVDLSFTADMRDNRVNVVVTDEKVAEVIGVG